MKANDFRFPITDRIAAMRHEVVHAKPILCSERGKLITESYKETESDHPMMRRAKAFKHILDNMTQLIFDGELIVGNHGSNGRRSAPIFPEFAIGWLVDEVDSTLETRAQDQFIVPEQVKKDIHEIASYWEGKTVFDKYRAMLPEETKKIRDSYVFTRDLFERSGYGHTAYNVRKVLNIGLEGIKDEIKGYIADLDLSKVEDFEKNIFYQAELINLDAVINFAKRYSETALRYAEKETDPKRKKELEKIADVCSHVPQYPARDLWEGIQVVAFMQLVIQTETSGDSVSPGRLDQFLYPLSKKTVEKGEIDHTCMQESLDNLWLKFNELIKIQDTESVHVHPGFPMTPNLTVGGQTENGEDATNELSYMMLNSQEHIRLTNPQFTTRIHKNTPQDFKERVSEVIKLGTGMPAMFGDERCFAAIKRMFPDMPMERVRDYSIVGCIELAPRGFQGKVNAGFLGDARVVDLALNNGVDRITGEQIGLQTGTHFETYEDFVEAVRKQIAYITKHQVINGHAVDLVQREITPHLFLSTLIEGCLEKGIDMTRGGSLWGATPVVHVGMATAVNSIIAVKKLIFDDKKYTLDDFNKALDADFKGYEDLQEDMMNAPKYGNDNDYADEVAVETVDAFTDIIETYRDSDNRPYTSMILTLGATVPHGWKTGATADGRNSTMPVSDSMSPANGTDTFGPTAVLQSSSKIDQTKLMQANVLNLKFAKSALNSKEDTEKFTQLFTTYLVDMEGQELQVQVIDGKEMREAQKHPENYQDLIVRVAGYSARFVELAKELQDDIIARTEHQAV